MFCNLITSWKKAECFSVADDSVSKTFKMKNENKSGKVAVYGSFYWLAIKWKRMVNFTRMCPNNTFVHVCCKIPHSWNRWQLYRNTCSVIGFTWFVMYNVYWTSPTLNYTTNIFTHSNCNFITLGNCIWKCCRKHKPHSSILCSLSMDMYVLLCLLLNCWSERYRIAVICKQSNNTSSELGFIYSVLTSDGDRKINTKIYGICLAVEIFRIYTLTLYD